MSSFEEQKRMVLPFLQRAEEIEKHDPKVAWYCRMHALETALSFPKASRDARINDLIKSVIGTVEKTKDKAGISDKEADKAYLEDFALKVFSRADKVDRAGLADKKTAVNFYAAFYFFEMLSQFGELADDIAEKQRYAAWKAAEINKALREGRTPTPGPAGSGMEGDEDLPTPPGFIPSTATIQPTPPAVDGMVRQDSFGLPEPPSGMHPGAAPGPPFTFDTADRHAAPGFVPRPPNGVAAQGQDYCGGDGEDDDGDLPDVPGTTPVGNGMAASRAGMIEVPGTMPEMQMGSRVLYAADPSTPPQRGTVARVTEDGRTLYVALPDRIVPCQREQLVYEVTAGDTAAYHHNGAVAGCMVHAVACQQWPPLCTILLPGGMLQDVSAELLAPINLPPPSRSVPQPPPPAAVPKHHNTPPIPPASPPDPPTTSATPPNAAARQPGHGSSTPSGVTGPGPATGPGPDMWQAPEQEQTSARHGTAPQQVRAGAHRGAVAAATSVVELPAAVPGYQPGLKAIADAHKQAKYAVSSLSFEDVPTAIKHLTNALKLLSSPQ